MPEHAGQTAVVTGASAGLGLAIAEAFAGAGARVVLVDFEADADAGRAAASRLVANGAEAYFVAGDVADPDSAARLPGSAAAVAGAPAVLVNAAACAAFGPALELEPATWRGALDRMLSGALYCGQAFARQMAAGGGGAIVNLVSMDAYHGQPGRAVHAAARTGLVGLTRSLAVEWAPLGIRVNAVAPGVILTETARQALERGEESLERYERRVPMGRLGTPREVAAAVLFVAGPRAGFLTGQTLRVDGGWAAVGSAAPGLVFPEW